MTSERLYRRLLALLPGELRESFGDDMTLLFGDRLAEARGPWGRTWIWLRAVSDVTVSALAELLGRNRAIRTRRHLLTVSNPARPDLRRRPPGDLMRTVFQDVRYAFRGMAKNPAFTLVSIVTLALGIGASTVAFTLVNGVLLRPLPFRDPDRLVMLWERQATGRELNLSYPNFDDWRNESQSFEGILAIRFAYDGSVLGGAEPTRGTILGVSREFFSVLGVRPLLGRPILPEENREGGEAVAVLGYEFWQRHFGSDPDLEGLTLTIASRPHAVVGVMPPGFKVLEDGDVYVAMERRPPRIRDSHNYRAIGRLAPGVTGQQAQEEMDGIAQGILAAYPGETQTVAVSMRPLRGEILGEADRLLVLVACAAGVLLLLACSNVASTLMARNTTREREMAIRTALGAARGRLVRQLFTESVILAGLAGVVGLVLSLFALELIRSRGVDLVPRLQTVSMDSRVMLFALGATMMTSVVFGLLPALRASGDPAGTLRGGRRFDGAGKQGVGWNLLVGGEAALAVVLMVTGGLLIRSLQEVLTEETYFRSEGVLTVAMDFTVNRYETAESRIAELDELKREFESLPGVTTVGFVNHLPMEGTMMTGPVFRSPPPPTRDPDRPGTSSGWRVVDEDYFTAMGIPVLQGRVFSRDDGPNAPPVAIFNEALARKIFPREDAIGKLVQTIGFWSGVDLTVVGVVAEARDWRREAGGQPEVFVYWPQRLGYTGDLIAVIHTAGDPAALAGAARERLRAVAPNVPGMIHTMSDLVGESLRERTFTLAVLGGFAALSLLLAAVGIYGVAGYSVSRRTREIGIRLALGAASGTVRQRIFSASLGVVALGTAVGVASAIAMGGVLESLLYGVSPRDPMILVVAPAILLAAAALAVWIPVVRYTRVDPLVTMRAE
jgi:putative ABC transport system permease protein